MDFYLAEHLIKIQNDKLASRRVPTVTQYSQL